MKTGRSTLAGYTVVEALIFLAVSGALFASAMLLVSGQQQKTQFNTATRELDAKIQSVMGDVATGHYNSSGNTSCDATGIAGRPNPLLTGGVQGTNGACTFLGQVIVPPIPGSDTFKIYSVVGWRTKTDNTEVVSYNDAKPTLFIDAMETYPINGADFRWIKYESGGDDTSPKSIGFLTSLGTYNGANLASGSGSTNVFAIKSVDTTSGTINGLLETQADGGGIAVAKNPSKIMICIDDGARNAVITITGGSTSTVIGSGGCA